MPGRSRSRATKALKAAALVAAALVVAAVSGTRMEPAYRYDGEEVAMAAVPAPEPLLQASLAPMAPGSARVTLGHAEFGGSRDMVSVKVWGADPDAPPRVTLLAGGRKLPLEIDIDGDARDADFLTTEPVFLDGVTRADVSVDWGAGEPGQVAVAAVDTRAHGWKLAWGKPAEADAGIVTRAGWGADEELRFADTDAWKKILKKNGAYKPTAADKKAAAKRLRIYEWLHKEYPQEFEGAVRRTTENGRPLIWPVENGAYMDKVVVHHTGEWNDDENMTRDEASMVRGIYYYHAHMRQWGDIGYNFIIGKSGTVYEGRAGGDYAVAAHAVWNNQTAVGISLMGAYDRQTPPKEQIVGLVKLLAYVSRKYGIDFSAQRTAHRECVGKSCPQDGETVPVPGLSGHRDVGHTNCPGANLYPLIAKIRQLETFSRGRTVITRAAAQLDAERLRTSVAALAGGSGTQTPDADTGTAMTASGGSGSPASAATVLSAAARTFSSESTVADSSPLAGTEGISQNPSQPPLVRGGATPETTTERNWPTDPAAKGVDERLIRVKLSVPDAATLKIAPADGGTMALAAGKKTGTAKNYLTFERSGKSGVTVRLAGKSVTFTEPVRLSGGVLAIENWSRKPAWDKSGTVNDNLFRGTLEIRNAGGKWLVIDELPVGQYVKGLGEVSEGDPEAKAKTIIVAARTYAAYYLQASNRKFPGQPYDGSDDPAVFQRYLGYGLEKRSPTLARYAQETRDVVVTYQGKLIKPWYFNASTGRTRSALDYCLANGGGKGCQDVPFLQAVDDPGTPAAKYLGHGVGISGNGASALARQGLSFQEIIKYFLKGVDVGKVG